jgi:solute carrier family 25 carnitine/acylcarnitine transporter 20/29
MKKFSELHLGEEAVGGLSAGIVGTVIGFPLDLAKTRMQTATSSKCQNHRVGIVVLLSDVVRKEGVAGLYKGIAPPLISLSILNVTTFTQYAYFRELYNANPGWDARNFAAGASCAPVSGVVSTVENLIKTQMMLDNVKAMQNHRPPQYSSSWNCITSLIRQYGLTIIYTGHTTNTIRELSFIGPYFFFYEGLRETLVTKLKQKEQQQQHRFNNNTSSSDSGSSGDNNDTQHIEWGIKVAVPVAGGLSGALSWGLSFPLDLVRSRVQGQNLPPTQGAWQLARQLVQERGFFALYTGSSASIARAFLVSGSRFSAYEASLWLLRGGRHYEKHHD